MQENKESKTISSKKQTEIEGKTLFIPVERLGVLESVVVEMTKEHRRRARQIEYNHVEQVLKTLRLIDWSTEVKSLALGCTKMGQIGLFITCKVAEVHAEAQLPGGA